MLARRVAGRPPAQRPDPRMADPVLAHASAEDRRIVERALPFTMTSAPRILAVIDAVRYCVARRVPGAFAECGVWRGGSCLAMVLTLQELGVSDRDIYLYDTFTGMTEPGYADVSELDGPALSIWRKAKQDGLQPWEEVFGPAVFNQSSVRSLLAETRYPDDRLRLIRGRVEETLPAAAPDELALLRLDTDWYESTRHELIHLFPRLSKSGVLIIDDYGHWQGARRAVDEYFSSAHPTLLMCRADYTGRIAVKQ